MKRIDELSNIVVKLIRRIKAHDIIILAQLWFIISILNMNSPTATYYTDRYDLRVLDTFLIFVFALGAVVTFTWRDYDAGFYIGGFPVLVFGLAGLVTMGITNETAVFIAISLLTLTRLAVHD